MNQLTPREKDLLERVNAKPEIRPFFFKKVKGLKWFNALDQAGYFKAENLPAPISSEEEGYVKIPSWEVVNYLVRTAQELENYEDASEYAHRFIDIIVRATEYAKYNKITNYHVWWQFAVILSQIPIEFISKQHLDIVDYWLDDKYDSGLVAKVIGINWIPILFEKSDEKSLTLVNKLLNILFKVVFVTEELTGRERTKAYLRFDIHRANKIIDKIAYSTGFYIKEKAINLFRSKITEILDQLGGDGFSSVWQPAIEDHEQNKYKNETENILLKAFRDSLCGYIDKDSNSSSEYIDGMLDSSHQTIVRVAIYCITRNYNQYSHLTDKLILTEYLQPIYRHEYWRFINKHYGQFSEEQQKKLLACIKEKNVTTEDGLSMEKATAYDRATWLAAIKDYGNVEHALYKDATRIANSEPDHPDFSYYFTISSYTQKSPYSIDELTSLPVTTLVDILQNYQDSNSLLEPNIEGLSNTLKQLFKNSPIKLSYELKHFINVDLAYIHSILEAYSELWNKKENLPWDDIWYHLLNYITTIIVQDEFWHSKNTRQRNSFVANRYWIVGSIANLIMSAVKSDDHAIPFEYHEQIEQILQILQKNESGRQFKYDSDAVFISINSPLGRCFEALINLTLRSCRIEDQYNEYGHELTWNHYKEHFDIALEHRSNREYEFTTLFANYIPNFLYMSRDWLLYNLHKIFDQSNYLKWLCAMQGYAHVNIVDEEVYSFLKNHGDLYRALDDEYLSNYVKEKIIQNIVVAYINDYEMIDNQDSLINNIIVRWNYYEIDHLIWFIWTLRQTDKNNFTKKIFYLWNLLISKIDLSTTNGTMLASKLCLWATYVHKIDENSKLLLKTIAPYADDDYNSYNLLNCLATISDDSPFEANEIWHTMIERSPSDFPEEAIKKLLNNLISYGSEGKRLAKVTASLYLEKGVSQPYEWYREILDQKPFK